MIKLIDREGYKVSMSKEEIAGSLRDMGNPPGVYEFVLNTTDRNDEWAVKMIRAKHNPFRFYQVWHKRFRHYLKQREARKAFDKVNDRGLIWKPIPFVLERPWLRLRGNKAVIIYVAR
jgi:hypothetical protein